MPTTDMPLSAYSLRIRPTVCDETPAPSPSTYSLPTLMTHSSASTKATSAAYSMGSRIKSASEAIQIVATCTTRSLVR